MGNPPPVDSQAEEHAFMKLLKEGPRGRNLLEVRGCSQAAESPWQQRFPILCAAGAAEPSRGFETLCKVQANVEA